MAGNEGQNRIKLVREAHIQHSVRFVENEGLQIAELDVVAAQVLVHPTGRTHYDVRATLQRCRLRT